MLGEYLPIDDESTAPHYSQEILPEMGGVPGVPVVLPIVLRFDGRVIAMQERNSSLIVFTIATERIEANDG